METYHKIEWVYYFSLLMFSFTNETTESNLCGDKVFKDEFIFNS